MAILQGVGKIVSSKQFVLAALSDLNNLLLSAVETSNKESRTTKAVIKKFGVAQKKAWFFLLWANGQEEKLFMGLQAGVWEEWEKQKETVKEKGIRKQPSEQQPKTIIGSESIPKEKKKPIVEEIK